MASRHFRTMALLVAAAPLGAALIALPVAPAQAASGDLSCSAALSLTFQPALVAGGKSTTTITGTASGCTSSNGQHTDLTAGTLSGSGSATGSGSIFFPCGVSPTASGTATVSWKKGTTSTVAWKVAGGSFTASVTDGELKGDKLTASLDGLPQASCGTNGGLATVAVNATAAFA